MACPGISTLERIVASARARARRDTYERLKPVLDARTRRALDALCVTDVRLGVSRLAWQGHEARSASPALGYEPASDELAGLTPTIFRARQHSGHPPTTSAVTPAGQLRPLRATTAA